MTVYHEGLCSGGDDSVIKETSNGIRYEKISTNSGDGIESGDIGISGKLSDGSYLLYGEFKEGVTDETDPNSWDNLSTRFDPIISDTTPPVITLTGNNPQIVQLGASYMELGAITDDGSNIVINSSGFVNAVGNYNITYNAVDSSGNVATEVVRVVNVVDTVAPIITLTGANPQIVAVGDGYSELGATSDDGSVVVIDSSAFVDALGSYNITYNSTDASGNIATEVIRTVTVQAALIDKAVVLPGQSNELPTTGSSATAENISFPVDTQQLGRLNGNNNTIIPAASPLDHSDQVNAKPNGFDVHLAIKHKVTNPNDRMLFIPASEAATGHSTNDWGVGNPLHIDTVNRIQQVKTLRPGVIFDKIIIFQGEADKDYKTWSVEKIAEIQAFRTAIGDSTTPVIFVIGTNRYHEQFPEFGANVTQAQLRIPNQIDYTSTVDTRLYGIIQNQRDNNVHYSETQQEAIADAIILADARARLNTNATGKTKTLAPANLTVIKNGVNVEVSWDAVTGAYDYWLEYSLNDGDWSHIAVSENTNNGLRTTISHIHNSLPQSGFTNYSIQEGDIIKYRVSAIKEDNFSDYSEVKTVVFSDVPFDKWVFGSDNPNHESSITGAPLTLVGASPTLVAEGTPVGVTENAISFTGVALNGLVTPYAQGLSYTICAIVEPYSSKNLMLFGTYVNPLVDHIGVCLYLQDSSSSLKGLGGGNPFAGFTHGALDTVNYNFIALSVNSDGTYFTFIGKQGGNVITTGTGTATQDLHNRNIGLGNCYFDSGAFHNTQKIAGAIVKGGNSTQQQVIDLYNQAFTEYGARGLVIA